MQRFLTAEWRKLIMANYEVEASILQPLLPAGTETDFWNGKTYLSLVGFMFNNTRVRGIRIPFHINFPEVNLRFYVRYKEKEDWKRGVVFIREIVPRPAITLVANSLFKERYMTLPMQYSINETSVLDGGSQTQLDVSYRWKFQGAWNNIEAQTISQKQALAEGSKEEFITEHFWGYSSVGRGITGEYRVDHPRWEIYPVHQHNIRCDFERIYGKAFGSLNGQNPQSVFLAEGSPVTVYNRRIITVKSS
jgi:uncharacterized protein